MNRFRGKYERPDLVTSETFLSVFWVMKGAVPIGAFLTESEAWSCIVEDKRRRLLGLMVELESPMILACDQFVPVIWAQLSKTIEIDREYLHAVWTCPICGREDEDAEVDEDTPQPMLCLCCRPRSTWTDVLLVEWPQVPDIVADLRHLGNSVN